MKAKTYNLPEIAFVGGETQDLRFRLFTKSGRIFDADGATATFSVVYSVNRTGATILSKQMTVMNDEHGIKSVLAVELLPKETVGLFGKYIYQITIKDSGGDVEIPSQGILTITNNIDKTLIR